MGCFAEVRCTLEVIGTTLGALGCIGIGVALHIINHQAGVERWLRERSVEAPELTGKEVDDLLET